MNKQTSNFKQEERYIVIKMKDLSEHQLQRLRNQMDEANVPTRACVVVEKHWPIYDAVWKLIEGLGGKKFARPSNGPSFSNGNPEFYRDGM